MGGGFLLGGAEMDCEGVEVACERVEVGVSLFIARHSHCDISVRCEEGRRGSLVSSSLDDQSEEPESSF